MKNQMTIKTPKNSASDSINVVQLKKLKLKKKLWIKLTEAFSSDLCPKVEPCPMIENIEDEIKKLVENKYQNKDKLKRILQIMSKFSLVDVDDLKKNMMKEV